MRQLIQRLQDAGIDGLWVTRPEHVRLLSGFTSPEDGRVLVTTNGSVLYTDARYTVQAAEESRIEHFIGSPPKPNAERECLEHAASRLAGGRVGFEAAHLTVAGLEALRAAWQTELVPTEGLIETLRAVKSPEELDQLREAQRIADEAYATVRPTITAGRTERDVALDLELAMRRLGAESAAFGITVASGPRGAMPHGGASARVIEEGDLVTIDMGARYQGYHSDMTRTIAVGTVSDELRRMYDAVLEAEEACLREARPGARCADLDALAREILGRHGLAQYFAHSLGHGIGLAVHEAPSLNSVSDAVLTAGMVVTIEPGVYIPGLGGVRIEDLAIVTEDGIDILSTAPKERV